MGLCLRLFVGLNSQHVRSLPLTRLIVVLLGEFFPKDLSHWTRPLCLVSEYVGVEYTAIHSIPTPTQPHRQIFIQDIGLNLK